MAGRIVIVATPIGNLGDLPPRGRAALEQADLVACEDTRRTGRLLHSLGLKRRLVSLHEHNEARRVEQILAEVAEGAVVALVSDAGTPLLSDPGYLLVREAIARQLAVDAVPGPSAGLVALVLSGLPPYPFTFAGFPPPKSGRRRAFYRRFADLDHTLLFFESPHRVLKSLTEAEEVLGDRQATLCRELTKLHQEILRGRLSEIRQQLESRPGVKGELVLVVDGCAAS